MEYGDNGMGVRRNKARFFLKIDKIVCNGHILQIEIKTATTIKIF